MNITTWQQRTSLARNFRTSRSIWIIETSFESEIFSALFVIFLDFYVVAIKQGRNGNICMIEWFWSKYGYGCLHESSK